MSAVLERTKEPPQSESPKEDEVWRWSLDQYHAMIEHGILKSGDPVEFLEGQIIPKMTKNSPHTATVRKLVRLFAAVVGALFDVHSQDPITLAESEPEPDLSIVDHDNDEYSHGHPTAIQTAIVVEVSDSTLTTDRELKKRIYARAAIPVYWIVNLVDRQVEVYSDPAAGIANPDYKQRRIFTAGQSTPVVLRGNEAGSITVSEILPN